MIATVMFLMLIIAAIPLIGCFCRSPLSKEDMPSAEDTSSAKTTVVLYCKNRNCGYEGTPLIIKGTKGMEIGLWVMGVFILPIAAAIGYSIWRRAGIKPNTCPKCGWEMLKQDRE